MQCSEDVFKAAIFNIIITGLLVCERCNSRLCNTKLCSSPLAQQSSEHLPAHCLTFYFQQLYCFGSESKLFWASGSSFQCKAVKTHCAHPAELQTSWLHLAAKEPYFQQEVVETKTELKENARQERRSFKMAVIKFKTCHLWLQLTQLSCGHSFTNTCFPLCYTASTVCPAQGSVLRCAWVWKLWTLSLLPRLWKAALFSMEAWSLTCVEEVSICDLFDSNFSSE